MINCSQLVMVSGSSVLDTPAARASRHHCRGHPRSPEEDKTDGAGDMTIVSLRVQNRHVGRAPDKHAANAYAVSVQRP